jgi:hypothetical protein
MNFSHFYIETVVVPHLRALLMPGPARRQCLPGSLEGATDLAFSNTWDCMALQHPTIAMALIGSPESPPSFLPSSQTL